MENFWYYTISLPPPPFFKQLEHSSHLFRVTVRVSVHLASVKNGKTIHINIHSALKALDFAERFADDRFRIVEESIAQLRDRGSLRRRSRVNPRSQGDTSLFTPARTIGFSNKCRRISSTRDDDNDDLASVQLRTRNLLRRILVSGDAWYDSSDYSQK